MANIKITALLMLLMAFSSCYASPDPAVATDNYFKALDECKDIKRQCGSRCFQRTNTDTNCLDCKSRVKNCYSNITASHLINKKQDSWSILDINGCSMEFPVDALEKGLVKMGWKPSMLLSYPISFAAWEGACKNNVAQDQGGRLIVIFNFADSVYNEDDYYTLMFYGKMNNGYFDGEIISRTGKWVNSRPFYGTHDEHETRFFALNGKSMTRNDFMAITNPEKLKSERKAEQESWAKKNQNNKQSCKQLYVGKAVRVEFYGMDYAGIITGISTENGVASIKITERTRAGEVHERRCSEYF